MGPKIQFHMTFIVTFLSQPIKNVKNSLPAIQKADFDL